MQCKSQGIPTHSTKKAQASWEKVCIQLCNILWQTIESMLMCFFRPRHIIQFGKKLVPLDMSHFVDVIPQMTNLIKESNLSATSRQV